MPKGRPTRFVFASDTHGDEIDPHAAGVLLNFMKAWKPEIRIHGGDAFEMAPLRKGATPEEKRQSMVDDIDAGCEFLDKFKPTHFLEGNHDIRLRDALNSDDGGISDLAKGFYPKINEALDGVQIFDYEASTGVLTIGNTNFLHGFQSGAGATRATAIVYGESVHGHNHAIDCASVARYQNGRLVYHAVGRGAGCMCKLRRKFNRSHVQTLRQNVGFIYGLVLPSGVVIKYQAESHDGVWYLPSEMHQVSSR